MNTTTTTAIEYFQAHSWWNIEKAKNFCDKQGYKYYMEGDNLMIQAVYTAAKFYIDTPKPLYNGYHRNMNDWNGWEQPYFEKKVVDKVIKDFNKGSNDSTYFKWEDEKLIYVDPDEDGCQFMIEPEEITVDGKQIQVWYFNNGWVWESKKK